MVSPTPSRRRAACDECRHKKLKCTSEFPICLRCERLNIDCVYSVQKPMGRPKKRRRLSGSSNPILSSTTPTASQPLTDDTVHPNDDALASSFDSDTWDISNVDYATIAPDLLNVLTPLSNDAPSTDIFSWEMITPIPELPVHSSDMALQQCACLSTMYLTLDNLSNMQDFAFPSSLHVLRKAVLTAWDVFHCQSCPNTFIKASQNVQLLGLLSINLTERYSKVLKAIDAEKQRCEIAGEAKSFRMGDMSPASAHLHNGQLDCPAAFVLELQPSEWSSMAKKVLRAEVHGKDNHNSPVLMILIQKLEERQHAWHLSRLTSDARELCKGVEAGEKPTCLTLAREARRMIDSITFD